LFVDNAEHVVPLSFTARKKVYGAFWKGKPVIVKKAMGNASLALEIARDEAVLSILAGDSSPTLYGGCLRSSGYHPEGAEMVRAPPLMVYERVRPWHAQDKYKLGLVERATYASQLLHIVERWSNSSIAGVPLIHCNAHTRQFGFNREGRIVLVDVDNFQVAGYAKTRECGAKVDKHRARNEAAELAKHAKGKTVEADALKSVLSRVRAINSVGGRHHKPATEGATLAPECESDCFRQEHLAKVGLMNVRERNCDEEKGRCFGYDERFNMYTVCGGIFYDFLLTEQREGVSHVHHFTADGVPGECSPGEEKEALDALAEEWRELLTDLISRCSSFSPDVRPKPRQARMTVDNFLRKLERIRKATFRKCGPEAFHDGSDWIDKQVVLPY
jgi:hypothetical protein